MDDARDWTGMTLEGQALRSTAEVLHLQVPHFHVVISGPSFQVLYLLVQRFQRPRIIFMS